MRPRVPTLPLALCLLGCGGAEDTTMQAASSSSSTTSPAAPASSSSGIEGPEESSSGAASTTSTGAVDTTETVGGTSEPPESLAPKSLVIAIDGLRADALAAADTPNLDAILLGDWQPGYVAAFTADALALTDAATLSGPNHWALMTGATGRQHGVTGNDDVGEGDGDAFPHYLTRLESDDATRGTVYLFTWPLDALVPCEADIVQAGQDDLNAAFAADLLSANFESERWPAGSDVDALFIFVDDVDGAGHGLGFAPDSQGYLDAIEEVDEQVGWMLDAIAQRPSFESESWQVVVSTDHGGLGTSHGGTTQEELRIPFGVTARAEAADPLPDGDRAGGGTRNLDVAPTVLQHFGLPIPAELTGSPRGPLTDG